MELLSEAKEKLEKGETETVILRKALDKQTEYGLSDVELAFGLSAPFAAGVSTVSLAFNGCLVVINKLYSLVLASRSSFVSNDSSGSQQR